MAKYILEVNGDITKDGHTMFVGDIVRDLNRTSLLEEKLRSGDHFKNLRDEFAAKSIPGLLTEYDTNDHLFSSACLDSKFTEIISKSAYSIADAMLIEREK